VRKWAPRLSSRTSAASTNKLPRSARFAASYAARVGSVARSTMASGPPPQPSVRWLPGGLQ
jgi:hypothetical protein